MSEIPRLAKDPAQPQIKEAHGIGRLQDDGGIGAEDDFLVAVRTFLLEQGFIESELRAILDETWTDARRSMPALARVPARLDRVLYRMERGELAVRTEPVDAQSRDDRGLGGAILAGALIVAWAILTIADGPYVVPVGILAAVFLISVLLRRGSEKPELPVHPDYYCRKHVIADESEDVWIHYMSHELVGLTEEELDRYYPAVSDEIKTMLLKADT